MNDREKLVFKLACRSGVLILESGGETFRAEETVRYICSSAGFTADVLALPTGIVFSATINGEPHSALVKRVKKRSTDLYSLNEVNAISRRFVSGNLDVESALKELDVLCGRKPINKLLLILCSGLA